MKAIDPIIDADLDAYVDGELDVARRTVVNQQATLDLANARLEAGSGTEFDTARAQAQLSGTLGSIAPLEAAVARLERQDAEDQGVEGALQEVGGARAHGLLLDRLHDDSPSLVDCQGESPGA